MTITPRSGMVGTTTKRKKEGEKDKAFRRYDAVVGVDNSVNHSACVAQLSRVDAG